MNNRIASVTILFFSGLFCLFSFNNCARLAGANAFQSTDSENSNVVDVAKTECASKSVAVSALSAGINDISPDCVADIPELFARRSGFAASVTGGRAGKVYAVANLDDNGPGSLREGLTSKEPLWIVFKVSGTIMLKSPIAVYDGDKTIDGRESDILVRNHGISFYGARNVIVENISIADAEAGTEEDAIQITWNPHTKKSADLIWVDHVSLSRFTDGLVDVTATDDGGARVTVTWSKLSNHDKAMIVGLHKTDFPLDSRINVTIHHNYFQNVGQRTPRVAQAYAHVYNNVIEFAYSGIASYDSARVRAESNFFIPLTTNKDATRYAITILDSAGNPIPNGFIYAPIAGIRANYGFDGAAIKSYQSVSVPVPGYSYSDIWSADLTNCNMNRIKNYVGYQSVVKAIPACN